MSFPQRIMVHHPSDNLQRYRYHTGAELTPVHEDEPCPPLFRDVGPQAMLRFLRGDLQRLAGPLSPITYLRTSDYREPYTDHAQIGRLVVLQPKLLSPWHSGIDTIYVAKAEHMIDREFLGFIPGALELHTVGNSLADVQNLSELQEHFGTSFYRDAIDDHVAKLDRLNRAHAETEPLAEPLRRILQCGMRDERTQLREWMQKTGLSETDLCTAWHHLPLERRGFLQEVLRTHEARLTP